jgi:hypothetical protein
VGANFGKVGFPAWLHANYGQKAQHVLLSQFNRYARYLHQPGTYLSSLFPRLIGAIDESKNKALENTKKSKLPNRSKSAKPDASASNADNDDLGTDPEAEASGEDDPDSEWKGISKLPGNWRNANTEALRKIVGQALRERWSTYLWDVLSFLIFSSVSRPQGRQRPMVAHPFQEQRICSAIGPSDRSYPR